MNWQRSTYIRTTVVALSGVALALGTSTPAIAAPSSSTSPPSMKSPPECQTQHLAGSLRNGEGAAGSVDYALTLRNTGTFTCRTGGFPGVSYSSARHGHQVGAAASRSGSPDGFVTLSPGHTAKAELAEVDPLNFPKATCQLTHVAGLRIYPPDQTVSLFIPQPMQACSNRSLSQLSVRAFTH